MPKFESCSLARESRYFSCGLHDEEEKRLQAARALDRPFYTYANGGLLAVRARGTFARSCTARAGLRRASARAWFTHALKLMLSA